MGHKKSKLINEEQVEKDFTVLTLSQIQYICKHTNLIDKEVCRRHVQFLTINSNGRMTKEHFTAILQDIWPKGNVQKFANYLFNSCDKNQNGFIDFTGFLLLAYQLTNENSFLGFMFDMFDTRQKGSLSREKVQLLLTALDELIGYPTDEKINPYISRRQTARLLQSLNENKNKRLSREQFINIKNTNWTDEDNGVGSLLIEHTC